MNAEEASRDMRELGYGPHLKIFELTMFPQIRLPNAPEWGWKQADG